MIFELLLMAILGLVNLIFSILPDIPKIDNSVFNSIFTYVGLIIENGKTLASVFLPMDLIKILLPLVVIIVSFEPIYKLVMWVIRKIPFLNIK